MSNVVVFHRLSHQATAEDIYVKEVSYEGGDYRLEIIDVFGTYDNFKRISHVYYNKLPDVVMVVYSVNSHQSSLEVAGYLKNFFKKR